MNTYFLKQAINSSEFKQQLPYIHFSDNQIVGAIEVCKSDRNKLLKRMNVKLHPETKPKKIGEVYIAEKSFKLKDKNSSKVFSFKKDSLGYMQDEYIDENELCLEESQQLIFYTKSFDKIAGFFDINIELKRLPRVAFLNIQFNEIYVTSQNRGKEFWLDLTCAATKMLNEMIANIYLQFDYQTDFLISVNSVMSNKYDIRITYGILKSMRLHLNNHKRNYPKTLVADCEILSFFETEDAFEMTDY